MAIYRGKSGSSSRRADAAAVLMIVSSADLIVDTFKPYLASAYSTCVRACVRA